MTLSPSIAIPQPTVGDVGVSQSVEQSGAPRLAPPETPSDNSTIPANLHDELFAECVRSFYDVEYVLTCIRSWPTQWEWNLFDAFNTQNNEL
jgi:hypothetical protein